MALANITAVLDEAVAEGSKYAFVLVKTHSNDESIIIPADKIEEKKAFYEETFDAEGNHKTYPDIALLHAVHGDAQANITLRKEYYGGIEEETEED